MSNRPKIKLSLSIGDLLIELIAWMVLIGIWVLTLKNYPSLPETIPIHYNRIGEVDKFGNKWNILMLPIISTILFLGLSILNTIPHTFNYPTKITKENAVQQYTLAVRLIRFLKLIIVLIFGSIVLQTINITTGKTTGLESCFLPFTLAFIFIPIAFYLIKSFQGNKNNIK